MLELQTSYRMVMCQHYGSETNHQQDSITNEMLALYDFLQNLLRSWLFVVEVIGWGWKPPADLKGMPADCWVCPVAGEKLPSLTKPVWAVVPLWGVRLPAWSCCCCWKFLACCILSCCWCCCINLNCCVSWWRTCCCWGLRFWVCCRQCNIWSCCWVR